MVEKTHFALWKPKFELMMFNDFHLEHGNMGGELDFST